jgi:hypothetical protein
MSSVVNPVQPRIEQADNVTVSRAYRLCVLGLELAGEAMLHAVTRMTSIPEIASQSHISTVDDHS